MKKFILSFLATVSVALIFYSCGSGSTSSDTDSYTGSSATSSGTDSDIRDTMFSQASYQYEVVSLFAPLLRFDQVQGDTNKCFPGDAGEYYEARESGDGSRICNTSYSSIQNGEIPIYYQYDKCQGYTAVTSTIGNAGNSCVTLLAGQSIDVGTVCIDDIGDQISITYTVTDGWELTEAHLWIGETLEDMPKTRKGNPKVGHFPYHSGDIAGETSYSFYDDISLCNQTAYMAAHAAVRRNNGDGAYQTESAWGSGPRIIEKGNWATYFTVEQSCTEILTYWFFYGWQDYCSPSLGAHHADWEHVVVKIIDGQLDRVMYFQHAGQYTRIPGNYEVYDYTHPVVYVGKNSHGSYHDDGGSGTCCYFEDFRNPGDANQHMKAWLNLAELSLSEDSPEWMRYSGTDYWDGLTGPLHRGEDLCYLQGCKGAWTPVCHTNGCMKSDIGDDTF
jgi:hypothetical protein